MSKKKTYKQGFADGYEKAKSDFWKALVSIEWL